MKKKIAILAQFPVWLIDSSIQAVKGHYAVWLVSLYQALHTICNRYEVHWVTLSKEVKARKIVESNKQFFHILPEKSVRLGQLFHYIRERFYISRELKSIKPDIVHAWGTEFYYALAGRDFSGMKVLSMQGILTACVKRAPMHKFQIAQSKFERFTLPAYSLITAESSWAVERCKEIAPDVKIIAWDYAVNEDFFSVSRSICHSPSCLIACTPTPLKDVETAILAFSKPELSHIKLYIAGIEEGIYKNLPPNIIPLGRVSRDKMKELLSLVWCVVHPSLADACPNIIKEARVVGVPCIVTTECGAKQYVIDNKSGFIIPTKSPDVLAEKVLLCTKNIQTATEMGNYDRERCRLALDSSTMLRNLIKIYDSF